VGGPERPDRPAVGVELPRDLREGIEAAVAGVPGEDLTDAVDRLIDRYRADRPADEPILSGPVDVAAYAVYRMPATFAAVRAALAQLARACPDLAPASQLDLGGGTGAAVWAARSVFSSLGTATVLDQVPEALEVGRRIDPPLPVTWRRSTMDELDTADLVTVSYVLSELSGADQAELVRRASLAAEQAVVVVEPGTPAGYRRILAARDVLVGLGRPIAAPCPHAQACPLLRGDWCHFGVRINRSALHRRLKSAELGYEDEKFSYVAAGPTPSQGWGRVLRRPQQRKGLVSLRVCTPDPGVATDLVSKRQGERYKAARDVTWGDTWP
jgi:ribosomal protein RSM22 (predicted rRNA methylase)